MRASFGGRPPYQNDTEIAEELYADPFAEEPHSRAHFQRYKAKIKRTALKSDVREKKRENGR